MCQGKKDDGIAPLLYDKLKFYVYIYILYFFADLLHGLTILSKIFQYNFVNITSIGSLVKTQIECIRMLYVVDNTDLNHETFNESFVIMSSQTMALMVDIFGDCLQRLEVQSSMELT